MKSGTERQRVSLCAPALELSTKKAQIRFQSDQIPRPSDKKKKKTLERWNFIYSPCIVLASLFVQVSNVGIRFPAVLLRLWWIQQCSLPRNKKQTVMNTGCGSNIAGEKHTNKRKLISTAVAFITPGHIANCKPVLKAEHVCRLELRVFRSNDLQRHFVLL